MICPACSSPIDGNSQFCSQCGTPLVTPEAEKNESLFWTAEFALVSSRFFLKDIGKFVVLMLISLSLISTLMGLASGNPEVIPMMILMLSVGTLGLTVLIFVIAALVLGNRGAAVYCLDEEGISAVFRSKATPLLEVSRWAGLLLGEGQLWASSVLAQAGESVRMEWNEIHKVRPYSGAGVLELGDSWHTALRVYCPPELYPQVLERIQSRAAVGERQRLERGVPTGGGAWAVLGWLGLTLVATLLGISWEPEQNDVGFMVVTTAMFVFLAGLLPGLVRRGIAFFGLLGALSVVGHRLYNAYDMQVWRRSWHLWPALFATLGCLILLAMSAYQMLRRDRFGRETAMGDG